jgi:hypothetical protein
MPAFLLAALAIVIAVRSVEARGRSAVSAVPVSWLFCGDLPVSVSDAIGRDAEARELKDRTCALLSWDNMPWLDEDDDDE